MTVLRGSRDGSRGAAASLGGGGDPEVSLSPPAGTPTARSPGRGKGQTLHVVRESAVIAKSFWLWELRQGLLLVGTAQEETKFVSGAEVVFSRPDPFPFVFDCFGLLFCRKVAAAPAGLAGELGSSPGSTM